MSTEPRFDTEAPGNSEMSYSTGTLMLIFPEGSLILTL